MWWPPPLWNGLRVCPCLTRPWPSSRRRSKRNEESSMSRWRSVSLNRALINRNVCSCSLKNCYTFHHHVFSPKWWLTRMRQSYSDSWNVWRERMLRWTETTMLKRWRPKLKINRPLVYERNWGSEAPAGRPSWRGYRDIQSMNCFCILTKCSG